MIRHLALPAPAHAQHREILREFPALEVVASRAHGERLVRIDARTWEVGDPDFFALDLLVGDAGGDEPTTLELEGSGDLTHAALAVLTRLQWAIEPPPRLREPVQVAARRCHRSLHDRGLPLVHADWLHALDAQTWVLRLAPDASDAVLIAALFHDVERLASEATTRVEQLAKDYDAFKRAHASTGARMTDAALAGVVPAGILRDAVALIAHHEEPEADPDLVLLNDADALSFFSRNAPGFLVWYGPAHTAKKVAWTLARMSVRARACLGTIRLPRNVAAMVEAAITRENAQREGRP